MTIQHIFGPVASRRLGRSLGIDLIPYKTCSYNCVYCECGRTTDLRTGRKVFFPPDEITRELEHALESGDDIDYITFAGSGEPTLSLSIGKIIAFLKNNYPQHRVAVLTNGSLLNLPEVRNDLILADLVIPTLSSVNQATYDHIHRPSPGLSATSHIKGLIAFREIFSGQIWLEIFLVPPLNTTEEELSGLWHAVRKINPDRIQLNMLDRPGTESWVIPLNLSEIEKTRDFFIGTKIPVDIIRLEPSLPRSSHDGSIAVQIEETLMRRPCTADDIAEMTGLHRNEVMKRIAVLLKEGKILTKTGDRGTFYHIPGNKQ